MADITDPVFRNEERLDDTTLRVTRRSTFTRQVHVMDLPITADEWRRYRAGDLLIQDALPDLSNAEREFLLTGTTQAEWDAMVADAEDEEDL